MSSSSWMDHNKMSSARSEPARSEPIVGLKDHYGLVRQLRLVPCAVGTTPISRVRLRLHRNAVESSGGGAEQRRTAARPAFRSGQVKEIMALRLLTGALKLGSKIKRMHVVQGVRSFSSTAEQFKIIKPGFDFGHPPFGSPCYGVPNVPIGDDGLPAYVDWSLVPGAVGPARDQGAGLCYIFAPLGCISSLNFLKTGKAVILSPQQVLDCNTLGGGTYGGNPMKVLDFVIKNGGILPESVYPFTGVRGICKTIKGPGVSIDDWWLIQENSEYALKYAVAYQPVVVEMRLEDFILVDNIKTRTETYKKGIITGPSHYKCNHSALLIGYGEEVAGQPDWKWSPNVERWGEEGKFYVARSTGQPGGALGILRNPFVPLKWSPNGIVTAKCNSCPNCFKKTFA